MNFKSLKCKADAIAFVKKNLQMMTNTALLDI